jgi:hypothetical protein
MTDVLWEITLRLAGPMSAVLIGAVVYWLGGIE